MATNEFYNLLKFNMCALSFVISRRMKRWWFRLVQSVRIGTAWQPKYCELLQGITFNLHFHSPHSYTMYTRVHWQWRSCKVNHVDFWSAFGHTHFCFHMRPLNILVVWPELIFPSCTRYTAKCMPEIAQTVVWRIAWPILFRKICRCVHQVALSALGRFTRWLSWL